MLTPELLATVGHTLHGEYWVTLLAKDLNVNLRSLQRWVAGEFKPSPEAQAGLLRDMRALLVKHAARVARVTAMVDKLTTQPATRA